MAALQFAIPLLALSLASVGMAYFRHITRVSDDARARQDNPA
jgi:hypothetical protein